MHPLAILRSLSTHDKHQIIRPVLEIPNRIEFRPIPDVRFETFPHQLYGHDIETTISMVNASDVVKDGAPVARALLSGPGAKPKIDNAGEISPNITLAEGLPIIETIDRLASHVDLILSEFEALFRT